MQSKHIGLLYIVYTRMAQNLYNIKFVIANMIDIVANDMISINESLQQQGAILRSRYHRKQQRKKFPKTRIYEP
jgi:hypothetical protein